MKKIIWTGNCKGIKGELKEKLATMKDDELAEFDGEQENISELLQKYGDLNHDAKYY